MQDHQTQLSCTVELQPGEKLALPPAIVNKVGPGRWLITVRSCPDATNSPALRRHDAFLNGYAPEDEGLYDDLPG